MKLLLSCLDMRKRVFVFVVGGVSEIASIGLEKGKGLAESAAKNATSGSQEAIQLGEVGKQAGAFGTTMKVIGKAAGATDAFLAAKEAYENPTAGNIAKAVVKTGLLFVKTNPLVSVLIIAADLSGLTDILFKW